MKKIAILGLCLAVGMAASAQKSLIKELNGASKKDGVKYSEILQKMTPAFTNPETAKSAEARFVVGQAGMKEYDDMVVKRAINGPDAVKPGDMANALLGGYEYMMEVMPLDQLPDEKGKVKPKFTDKAAQAVASHYYDFKNTGILAYQAEDHNNAAKLWEIYLGMPTDQRLGKHAPASDPDSITSNFYKFLAFSYYLNPEKNLDKAIESILKGARLNPADKEKYDLAMQFAREKGDADVVLATAKECLAQYPTEGQYHLDIIQVYLNNKDLQAATNYIDEALKSDPNDGQLYFAKGIILDNSGDQEGAIKLYEKALELKPDFARALFSHANARTNILGHQQDAVDQKNYSKFKKEIFIPTLQEIKAELLKAQELVGDDKDLARQIDNLLDTVLYNLGE